MIRLCVQLHIRAPVQRCFDLARSIDLHLVSQSGHREEVVAGVSSGLIKMGEEVTWRARHLGIRQTFSSRITGFDPPHFFRDTMVRGAFGRFEHEHRFEPSGDGTSMTDECIFSAPLGPLGWVAERLFLRRIMLHLLRDRGEAIRRAAESDEWKRYLAA